MSFGETITSLRKGKGITQEQLAEELGVTRQTISKWELDQSTPDLIYISRLSDMFGVTTDYLIKGAESETTGTDDAKEMYEQIVGNCHEQAKQIIYVEKSSGIGSLKATGVVGIAMAILGVLFTVVGMVMMEQNGDWLLAVIFGVLSLIVGMELFLVKKHPILVALWTVWILVFLFIFTFMVNATAGGHIIGFNTMGEIVNTIHLIYFIALFIGTALVIWKDKKK